MSYIITINIIPVSYTHLDVYKRQARPPVTLVWYSCGIGFVTPYIGCLLYTSFGIIKDKTHVEDKTNITANNNRNKHFSVYAITNIL